MKRIRIHMLASVDSLIAGENYNVLPELANLLISKGKATRVPEIVYLGEFTSKPLPTFEVQTAGPSEVKPVVPENVQEIRPRKKTARKAASQ